MNGGDSGRMLKKVSNNVSSKLEYFQKLDREMNSPQRASLMKSSVNGVNGHDRSLEIVSLV